MGRVNLDDVDYLETVTISELPILGESAGSDIMPVVSGGATQQISKTNHAKNTQIRSENVLYVAKNGVDSNTGSIGDPFLTQQAACNYAIDNMAPSLDNMVGITVFPGIYNEQIHSIEGIFIAGVEPSYPINEKKAVVLYNTGADEDHYPLRGNDGDYYAIRNMIIRTDAGGTFGKICNSRFAQCRYEGGFFIEGTEDISVYATFFDCSFYNCKGFNLIGVAPNGRYLVFERCWNGWNHPATFESTHAVGNAVIDMDGGHLAFTKLSVKGDWYHFAKNYHSFGSVRHEYGTTKGIVYRGVTVTNGIHFVSSPVSLKVVDCGFEDGAESPVPEGEADITSDVVITGVECLNNSFHNGLSGNIRITDNIRDVGGGRNKYLCLQCAIDSIASGEDGVIRLNDSFTDLAELILNDNVSVVIDGQRTHKLTFSADIVELGLNQVLTFSRMCQIIGGAVEINGNGAEFHAHSCNHSSMLHIVMTSGVGAKLHLNNSSYQGDVGHPALEINNVDPDMLIEYSKLKGASGQPSIHYTVAADSQLKVKFSTLIHGSGGANYPIVRTGAFSVTFSIYNSAGNETFLPPAGGLSNSISGPNNTDDNALDF